MRQQAQKREGIAVALKRLPLLTSSVIAVLAICTLAVTAGTLVSLGRSNDVGYPDSATLLIVREYVRSGQIYLGVHSPPYLVTLYGPLTYPILSIPYRLAEMVGATPQVMIRFFLLCAMLSCAAIVFAISKRLNGSSPLAWLCVLFAVSTPALAWWITQVRADFLGLAFSLLSVLLFIRSGERRLPINAAVCAGLALLFKMTFVAAPTAILFHLLFRRRWREATFWSLGVAFVGAGGYALALWREPLMVEHLAALRDPVFEFRGALSILLGAIALPAIPFAVMGGYLAQRRGSDEGRLFLLYVILAWLVALATIPQVGGNINYFWEPLFASAVLAGPGVYETQRRIGPANILASVVCLVLLLSLVLRRDFDILRESYGELESSARHRASWQLLASVASGRRLLSTYPDVTMLGASPEMPDPYLNAVLEHRGRWNSSPIVAAIEASEYELIVTKRVASNYRGIASWNEAMWAALARTYEPVCVFDGRQIWLPNQRVRDAALLALCNSS